MLWTNYQKVINSYYFYVLEIVMYIRLALLITKLCLFFRSPYNNDMYEPPTRLRDTHQSMTSPVSRHVVRRGSASSNDYSETYHTTSRNDDPKRPSVTNTVQSFSKKTVPTKDGRNFQTIESTETKSVTKSRYVGDSPNRYYETDRKYISSAPKPVVIEVRNNYKK